MPRKGWRFVLLSFLSFFSLSSADTLASCLLARHVLSSTSSNKQYSVAYRCAAVYPPKPPGAPFSRPPRRRAPHLSRRVQLSSTYTIYICFFFLFLSFFLSLSLLFSSSSLLRSSRISLRARAPRFLFRFFPFVDSTRLFGEGNAKRNAVSSQANHSLSLIMLAARSIAC